MFPPKCMFCSPFSFPMRGLLHNGIPRGGLPWVGHTRWGLPRVSPPRGNPLEPKGNVIINLRLHRHLLARLTWPSMNSFSPPIWLSAWGSIMRLGPSAMFLISERFVAVLQCLRFLGLLPNGFTFIVWEDRYGVPCYIRVQTTWMEHISSSILSNGDVRE